MWNHGNPGETIPCNLAPPKTQNLYFRLFSISSNVSQNLLNYADDQFQNLDSFNVREHQQKTVMKKISADVQSDFNQQEIKELRTYKRYSQTCMRQLLLGPFRSGHLGQVVIL